MSVELATAFISLVPSLKGLSEAISVGIREAGGSITSAGETAGRQFTAAFGPAVTSRMAATKAQIGEVGASLTVAGEKATAMGVAAQSAAAKAGAALGTVSAKAAVVGLSSQEAAAKMAAIGTATRASATVGTTALDRLQAVATLTGLKAAQAMTVYREASIRAVGGTAEAQAAAQRFGAQATLAAVRASEAMKAYGLAATTSAGEASAAAAGASSKIGAVATKSSGMIKGLAGGLLAGFAITGGIEFFKDAATAAGDSAKAAKLVKNQFGDAAKEVLAFGDTAAKAFGLSAAASNTAASKFGEFLEAFKVGKTEAAAMSIKLVGLSSDIAKFSGSDAATVQDAIQTALKGRATALLQFGIRMSQANVYTEALNEGLVKQGQKMSDVQQVTATYNLLLKETTDKQGAFARSFGTAGTTQAQLKAGLQNLAAEIGKSVTPMLAALSNIAANVLLPALKAVLSVVTPVINVFANLPKPVSMTIAALGLLAIVGPKIVTALTNMMTKAGGAAGAIGKLGKVFAIGAVIAVATKIFSDFSRSMTVIADTQKEVSAANSALVDILVSNGGKLDDAFKSQQLSIVTTSDKYGELVRAGISTTDMLDLFTGKTQDSSKVIKQLFDAANNGKLNLSPSDFQAMVAWVTDMGNASADVQGTAATLRTYSAAQSATAATTVTLTKVTSTFMDTFFKKTPGVNNPMFILIQSIFEKLPAVENAFTNVFSNIAKSVGTSVGAINTDVMSMPHNMAIAAQQADLSAMTKAIDHAGESAQLAATRVDAFAIAVDNLTGRHRTAEEATKLLNDTTRAIAASFKDATDSTNGQAESLISATGVINTTTEAGSKLYDGVSAFAHAYDVATASAVDNAPANDTAAQKMDLARQAADGARKKFLDSADAMGINHEKAMKMADAMGILEGKKLTPKMLGLSAQDDASPKVDALKKKTDALTDKNIKVTIDAIGTAGGAVIANFAKFFGSTATDIGAGLGVAGHATGGTIFGPGTGTSDDVLLWGSTGEEIIKADQAEKHRPLLKMINAGVGGFATGGTVGGPGTIQGISGAFNGWSAKNPNVNIAMSAPGMEQAGPWLSQGFGSAVSSATSAVTAAIKKAKAASDAAIAAKAAAAAISAVTGAFTGSIPNLGGSGVEQWRGLATQVTAAKGQALAGVQVMLNQMSRESGGNPNAINLTDINAQEGHPSVGLLQFIPSTFASYADPGFNSNVWDPASQMHAWWNYINAVYGGYASFAGRGYGAYAKGGTISGDQLALVHSGEEVISATPAAKYRPLLKAINAQGFAAGGTVNPFGLAGIPSVQRGTRLSQYYSELDALHQAAAQAAQGSHKVAVAYFRVWQATGPLQRVQGSLANTYDYMTSRLVAAQSTLATDRASKASLVSSVAGTISGFDSGILGHTAQRGTPQSILAGLQFDLRKESTFTAQLGKLRKSGLSPALINQLASAGIDTAGGTVTALAGASRAQIGAINATQAKINAAGQAGGALVGSAVYDPTLRSDIAAVHAMQHQTGVLDAAMRGIGPAIEKAIDRAMHGLRMQTPDAQGWARIVRTGEKALSGRA